MVFLGLMGFVHCMLQFSSFLLQRHSGIFNLVAYLLGEPTKSDMPSSESQIDHLILCLWAMVMESVTVGIEDMFLKAIVPDDIHDGDVARYYMELYKLLKRIYQLW
ncbi:hypothetical protein Tco_0159904, partial [Tanacetum coccineum]